MKTWVAVVNRTEARLYETNEKNGVFDKKLKLVKRLENPRGRLKKQEINADRPGSATTSFTYSRTNFEKPQDPVDRITEMFAKTISEELERGLNAHLYDKLILVSEPHFLGKVRWALSKNTANAVIETLHKDLAHVPDHELPHFLWPKKPQQEVELRI